MSVRRIPPNPKMAARAAKRRRILAERGWTFHTDPHTGQEIATPPSDEPTERSVAPVTVGEAPNRHRRWRIGSRRPKPPPGYSEGLS